ncbi:MAG: hypothetical protein KDA29_14515 [Phycisphaerales bacterium]|nr:hypothetical protein [Phycisphaerales bacterium]
MIEQIDHNALKLSKRCGYSSSDIEDIKQDIRLHLFQKESAYDPERGTPGAYANHIVKTWLWTKLKYLNQQCRKGRMYKWSFLPAEEPLDPRGLDQVVDSAVASELLTTALAQLSSQDVWVVRLTREHGQVRASKLLGIKRRQLRHQLRFVSAICSDLHSFSEKAAKP